MPYRNALRDNWMRYMDANDAEMRMIARDRASQQPQGMYANSGGLSMDDIGYDAEGNLVILSEQRDPNIYAGRRAMPQAPQPAQSLQDPNYNPQAGINAIQRRNEELAAALEY